MVGQSWLIGPPHDLTDRARGSWATGQSRHITVRHDTAHRNPAQHMQHPAREHRWRGTFNHDGILEPMLRAVPLPADRLDEVIDVFSDAFHDYPVMRWVVGPDGDVAARVRRLIALFVTRRLMRGGPMLGVFSGERLAGAAILTLPVEPEPPAGITALAEDAWRELGEGARMRYQRYAEVTAPFFTGVGSHHHLNMIGVRRSYAGQGFARPLLDAVQDLCIADPTSAGVSLTTERDRNVELYQHFGYAVIAHEPVDDGLETWGLVRPRA